MPITRATGKRSLVRVVMSLLMSSALIAAPMSGAAAKPTTETTHFRGATVGGYASISDGCHDGETYLDAYYDGELERYRVRYSTYTFNSCTGGLVEGSYGEGDVSELTVSGPLSSASLTATITVYNYVTEASDSLTINETFSGFGKAIRTQDKSSYGLPGEFNVVSRSSGVFRDASASGTVHLDWAYIRQVRSGSVSVVHY